MEVKVRYLDNLRLEASLDDFKIITDQPIRYKGDGTAPSPFDYFLASTALCAAYFVKVYCKARDIPTEDIRLSQVNVVSPENRYEQSFQIKVELPAGLSEKHRKGILQAIERCTVKKVIQEGPQFVVTPVKALDSESGLMALDTIADTSASTHILGRELALEDTIKTMSAILEDLGIQTEAMSWRNLVPNVWSVHLRDVTTPLCFTNGKGASKQSALCSALGEYMERLSCNYFYNDHYLGADIASRSFVHYPNEKWFLVDEDDTIPEGLMDAHLLAHYDNDGELSASHLYDSNSGNIERGICALPFSRASDNQVVYIPVGLIGNLFVSNGMSAGNTLNEAKVQALSEIFERAIKNKIITEEIALPDVPSEVIEKYPKIAAGIVELEERGYPILVKDASLGGKYPVICVTLLNPKNGGVFASFGSHPKFEVALERSLTELLQGRSFESLKDVLPPTFSSEAVQEPNNCVEHFIDSTGVISWRFFSSNAAFSFVEWNEPGSIKDELSFLLDILKQLEKEVYVAEYEDLGAKACRILVPGFSEIYPATDLVWDNTNKALAFRDDVLNLHDLGDTELTDLIDRFEEFSIDKFTRVAELIGIEFDENSTWGELTVGELQVWALLAIGRQEEARFELSSVMQFNENCQERRLFFAVLDAALAVSLDPELSSQQFTAVWNKLYGKETTELAIDVCEAKRRFPGLEPIGKDLENAERHQLLLASYDKLHKARERYFSDRL